MQLTTSVIFETVGEGSEYTRKMRARLQDPQQRAELREEQREFFVDWNYDVAQALELDAATYEKLIELVIDQQMQLLYQLHFHPLSSSEPQDLGSHRQSQVERMNRDIDALRKVLGQEKLERYQAYQATLGERRQVRELEEYLQPADRLNPRQKEQLIELFKSHYLRFIQDYHVTTGLSSSLNALREMPSASQEELQRHSQLMNIQSNEDSWRRAPELDRLLREQAAAFLTASQLSAFERLHADKLRMHQQSIEQMRVQAGLSPNIPAQAEGQAAEPTPARVVRGVRVRLNIAVNRGKPFTITQIVSSGTPLTFEVDEGLLVEATPTVFSNDTYELQLEYFEHGTTGKRSIGNMGTAGWLQRTPPADEALMGGSSTVITGSKAYGIELRTSVEAT